MPSYTYMDACGHLTIIFHRMLYSTGITCDICGSGMWRKPSVPNINWNGLKPSDGEYSPAARNLFNTREERLDAYYQKKETRTED